MRQLLIATSNPGKLREVQAVLADLPLTLLTLREFSAVPEAVEDGETFEENACRKALHYARHTRHWTLADDSGLEVDARGGAPGVYSARYAGPQATDADNNARLIRELAQVPAEKRTARFHCVMALARPSNLGLAGDAQHPPSRAVEGGVSASSPPHELRQDPSIMAIAHGTFEGVIIDHPRGSNGFGYDPHFLIPELGLTSAELPPERKNVLSHRGQALRVIRPSIERLLHRGFDSRGCAKEGR